MTLFDSDFLARLEYLSLVSRRVFQGSLFAQQRSRELGAGLEFADHNAYAAGDDLRYLDWNVYARSDHMLLKRFQEEQDLHVYVLIDCSQSMATGGKFDHARRMAAALAYIALADLDRASVTAFAGDVTNTFALTRGKSRILAVMQFLESLEISRGKTDMARSFGSFVRNTHRRGPVIIISDLYDPAGFERGIDLLRYHRFEPHIVRLFDPAEASPTLLGDMELIDTETGTQRQVTVTEQHLARYRKVYEAFVASLRRYCKRYEVGCTDAPTDVAFDTLILAMMRVAGAAT